MSLEHPTRLAKPDCHGQPGLEPCMQASRRMGAVRRGACRLWHAAKHTGRRTCARVASEEQLRQRVQLDVFLGHVGLPRAVVLVGKHVVKRLPTPPCTVSVPPQVASVFQ